MNDERPFERLARHAGPAEVDPAFGDRLYMALQRDIGRPQRSMGQAVLLVAALLTALTVAGTVAVGSGFITPPWVNRLVMPSASAAPSEVEPTPSPPPTPTPSRSPGTWTATGSMITARVGTATLLRDDTVLVAGGTDGSEIFASAELFDPATGSWLTTGSMLQDRVGQSATLLSDGTVLVAGGNSGADPDSALASAELYDPVTGTWTTTGVLTQARTGHSATLLPDGRVLVAGGYASTANLLLVGYERLASAELYDPATGRWTATGDMTQARDAHTATLLNDGRVLVAGGGGNSGGRQASAELYDPVTGAWTATGDMTESYLGHTATLLPNGTVLVAGGDAPSGSGARGWPHAAVYHPLTGTWAATGGMVMPRLGHTATLLPDGRVLVSGGGMHGGPDSPLLREAELYDPVSGTWAPTEDMIEARDGHTATLLPDGRVLVSGVAGSNPSTSAELYEPGGGT